MSHKKRASTAFKSIGAAGLAAATIVSGLSLGVSSASASAREPAERAASRATDLGRVPLVWKSGNSWYSLVRDGNLKPTAYASEAAAAQAAYSETFFNVRLNDDGTFRFVQGSNYCASDQYRAKYGTTLFDADYACGNGTDTWRLASGGKIQNTATNRYIGPTAYIMQSNGHPWYWMGTGSGYQFPGITELVEAAKTRALTADVSSVDNIAKSAVVSGTATPKGTVTIGSKTVNVDDNGKWSMTVEGLTAGSNSLTAVQKVNNVKVDEKPLTVTIVEGGTVVGVDQGPVELTRGESTRVPMVVQNNEFRAEWDGTVVLNAPEGTTFDGQTRIDAEYGGASGSTWEPITSMPLTNGRLSNDDKTITFDAKWTSGHGAPEQYRYMVNVTADEDAAAGASQMGFVFAGNSSKGGFRAEGKTTTNLEIAQRELTAALESVDHAAGSAVLTGTATPGATIAVGEQSTTANEDGDWSLEVTGLESGPNSLLVEQKIGDDTVDSKPVTVTINDAAIVGQDGAAATLQRGETTKVEAQFQTKGDVSRPDAQVTFTAPEGTTFAEGQNTIEGSYKRPGEDWTNRSATLTNGDLSMDGKTYTFTFKPTSSTWTLPDASLLRWSIEVETPAEIADGTPSMTTTLAGTAVEGSFDTSSTTATTIAAPLTAAVDSVDDDAMSAVVSGTATKGAEVSIGDQRTTADETTGAWSITVTGLEDGDNELTVVQKVNGVEVDRKTVTATVERDTELAPITLSGPASVTPGRSNTFTGTGEPGATYRVLNVSGTQIVPGTLDIDENGSWTFNRVVSNGAPNFRFVIEQTKNGKTTKSELFTINAAALTPVTVTTPERVTPGRSNTFTGTGEPGATYRVLNVSGTQIVPGTFEIDAQGNWTFNRVVSNGAPNFRFVIEQTKNGQTEKSELFTIAAADFAPVTVANRSVTPGVVNTFSGTGEPDASYRVLNVSGTQIVPGTFEVDGQGNWTFDRAVSRGATEFRFALELTKNGKTERSELFTLPADTK
ncbi:hypothetical protein [Curtobacterium flaccumfaciens]|uniref:hypothetical protein n=1 Tax=Curtobacterium flaccumfaciens TaxID=2035 RepID=UPI00399F9423